MEFNDIDINEIAFKKRRKKTDYKELYDRMFALEVGSAFEVVLNSNDEARDLNCSVLQMLKRKGLKDNYIRCHKKNKFYCGRIK